MGLEIGKTVYIIYVKIMKTLIYITHVLFVAL